jgi:hypothetical protein
MNNSVYYPDVWRLIEVQAPNAKAYQKILAGWYGGYAGSDSWQISSGVVDIIDKGDYWEVTNESGSVYNCGKTVERFSGYTQSIFSSFLKDIEALNNGSSMILLDMKDFYPLPKVQDSGTDQTPED